MPASPDLDIVELLAAHAFGLGGEPSPLVISEQQTLGAKVFAKDTVFGLEIFDDVTLMAIGPAGEGQLQELKTQRVPVFSVR